MTWSPHIAYDKELVTPYLSTLLWNFYLGFWLLKMTKNSRFLKISLYFLHKTWKISFLFSSVIDFTKQKLPIKSFLVINTKITYFEIGLTRRHDLNIQNKIVQYTFLGVAASLHYIIYRVKCSTVAENSMQPKTKAPEIK